MCGCTATYSCGCTGERGAKGEPGIQGEMGNLTAAAATFYVPFTGSPSSVDFNGVAVTNAGTLTSSGTGGVGYQAGAGGTVTQLTNRSTGVTLSKLTGTITTDTASLAALAAATFTVTNTLVGINDVIILNKRSGATNVKTHCIVSAVAAGSFNITVHNIDASTAETGAIIINFAVIRGATT